MKSFYIVPNARCYETIESESAADALVDFAENMDSDMSAYFSAVEKKPIEHPHIYEYAEGKFEISMSIIVATMTKDDRSPYYIAGCLDDISLVRMDAVSKLQESYDMLKTVHPSTAYLVRGQYYKLLTAMTGFKLDKATKYTIKERRNNG